MWIYWNFSLVKVKTFTTKNAVLEKHRLKVTRIWGCIFWWTQFIKTTVETCLKESKLKISG